MLNSKSLSPLLLKCAHNVVFDELQAKGLPASYEDILKNVQERDYIDSHREVSPLRQAEDALVLDNSHLTRAEQNQWLLQQFDTAVRNAQ